MMQSLDVLLSAHPKAKTLLEYLVDETALQKCDLPGLLQLIEPVGLRLECVCTTLNHLQEDQETRLACILLKVLDDRLSPSKRLVGAPYVLNELLVFRLLPGCALMLVTVEPLLGSDRLAKAAMN